MRSFKVLILAAGILFSNFGYGMGALKSAAISGLCGAAVCLKKAVVPAIVTGMALEWSKRDVPGDLSGEQSAKLEYFRLYAPDEVSLLGEHMKSFNTFHALTTGLSTGATFAGCYGFITIPAIYGLITGTDISDDNYYTFGALMTPISFGVACVAAPIGAVIGAVAMPLLTLAVRGYGSALGSGV